MQNLIGQAKPVQSLSVLKRAFTYQRRQLLKELLGATASHLTVTFPLLTEVKKHKISEWQLTALSCRSRRADAIRRHTKCGHSTARAANP
ncbi:hypothetical protein, partial [Cypionkella sp.]|uniref:hypothetical protein n=1 Tax=Cypionkella sp. TaxID=2811411 RepID=UPI00262A1DDA